MKPVAKGEGGQDKGEAVETALASGGLEDAFPTGGDAPEPGRFGAALEEQGLQTPDAELGRLGEEGFEPRALGDGEGQLQLPPGGLASLALGQDADTHSPPSGFLDLGLGFLALAIEELEPVSPAQPKHRPQMSTQVLGKQDFLPWFGEFRKVVTISQGGENTSGVRIRSRFFPSPTEQGRNPKGFAPK